MFSANQYRSVRAERLVWAVVSQTGLVGAEWREAMRTADMSLCALNQGFSEAVRYILIHIGECGQTHPGFIMNLTLN